MSIFVGEQFTSYSGDGRNDQCKFLVIPRRITYTLLTTVFTDSRRIIPTSRIIIIIPNECKVYNYGSHDSCDY